VGGSTAKGGSEEHSKGREKKKEKEEEEEEEENRTRGYIGENEDKKKAGCMLCDVFFFLLEWSPHLA